MLKAVKESLKNWLVTHERLYWYIVVGLAVLAFGVITAIGCAKLEKANAAEVKDFIIPWNGVDTAISNDGLEYYFIAYGESHSPGGVRAYFSDKPFVGYMSGANYVIKGEGCTLIAYGQGNTANISNNKADYSGGSNVAFDFTSYASNCGLRDESGNVLLAPIEYAPLMEYSASAPYFTGVTYGNVNLFMIDGNTNFEESTFRFVFDIADDGPEYVSRSTKMSGYVYLPSKDFITKAVQYYMGGRDTLDAYYSIYSCKEYPNWLNSIDIGDGSTFKKWYFTFDAECGENLDLRLTHEQIYSLVEECNSIDLREYYEISDVAYIDHILKGYMWVHRLDGYITTTYSDVVKYGNMTSFVLSTYLKDPIVVVGNSDPNFVGPMLPDVDIQQNINQAYKDALDEAIKENESLNDSFNGLLDTNGAYGDLEGSDLWKSFRSLADGLASMAPAVRAIALLSGSVLAFMPLQVQGMISFTLVALCIIAIIKAIRG